MIYPFIFVIGLCLGSFLSVLLARLDRKGGILGGRSECPECSIPLKWYDLIPLASYLCLKGKCRYCRADIGPIYPIVELLVGFSLLLFSIFNGSVSNIEYFYSSFAIFLFLALAVFDFLYFILPDKIVFTIGGAALAYNAFFRQEEFFSLLFAGFLFGLAFAIIYVASKGKWMGFGDVKLVLVIGMVLGYSGFFAIMLSVWTAAILGIILILINRANLKTPLPFGSFLSAMTIIFIIFKDVIQEKINLFYYFIQ